MQKGCKETTFFQTVSIQPDEFGPNIRQLAIKKLRDDLKEKKGIIKIVNTSFASGALVVPSYGHVNYKIQVEAIMFEPFEGLIAPARIVDVRAQGIIMNMDFLICFIPTLWLGRESATVNTIQKNVTYRGRTYRIGESIEVKIIKMKEKAGQMEAIVELAKT